MNAPLANGSMNPNSARKMVSYTTTALKRWSCYSPRELPPISQVKALHVYDFDNTLFMSPLPNRKLWTGPTVNFLQSQDALVNGGWWHDERILEATGEGMDKEESKAWKGWWNEEIVELVEMSIKQDDALTILLTGRAERNFTEVIKRIVASKNLMFDMICLKPQAGPNNQRITSTMKYKQAILEDLVHTYKEANEIRIYEDRPRHTQAFREYFQDFNTMLMSPTAPTPRKRINAEIVQVPDTVTTLDPLVETTEVQRMINGHNIAIRSENPMQLLPYEIKRTVFFTGYLLAQQDSLRLSDLIEMPKRSENGTIFLANSILICSRPPSTSILKQIGGFGHKQKWQVTGVGNHQSRIWAARVAPVPANSSVHFENPVPLVVLAMLRDSRPSDANYIQNWQPVSKEKSQVFETTVGEKVQLRIEQEDIDHEFDRSYNEFKRPHGHDNDRPGRDRPFRQTRGGYNNNDENRKPNGQGNLRGGYQARGRGNGPSGGQHRGRGGGRGGANRGGGNNRGRGRGYKSLDDIGPGNNRYDGNRDRTYNDGPGYSGDPYKAAFPPLGGGDGTADGGLSY